MQLNISENKSQNLNILAKVSHCSGHIWQNKAKSAICVVEDNSEGCVGHHDKKGAYGQDPTLWRRKVTFSLPATNMTSYEKQIREALICFLKPFSLTEARLRLES